MSTLDAGFFFVEHENVPMHLGSLVVFEGPAPAFSDLCELYTAKIGLVPRYRQVVRTSPLNVFRPVWVDDERFDLAYHMRHTVVPKPGGERELRRLAEQIFAQPLDRGKPLWEAWFLDGLQDGQWAILSKVHHCVVDGIGGSDLMAAVFDLAPDAPRAAPVPWAPQPAPSAASLVASGIRDAATWPLRQLAGLPGYVRERLRSRAELLGFGRGLGVSARRLAAPSASSLNGPIGPGRRWVWTTSSLSRVKRIRMGLGGTVNDVLLAAITRGFRDLLSERSELSEGVVVRSLVPISVRGEDEHGVLTNRVSAVLANLPVAEPDPVLRLEALRAQMDEIKRTHQVVGAELLTELLGFAAPTLLAVGTHAAFQVPQPLVQTVTTNVPGPRFPLYILGRQMIAAYPYVPIGDNVRISIAIYSYRDRLSFGVTADRASCADVEVVTRGIRRGLTELASRASASRASASRTSAARSSSSRRAGAGSGRRGRPAGASGSGRSSRAGRLR